MGFLASSASRQPLPVKITKAPLTVPWNTVENSWALRTQRPQVPSPGHLSIRESHLCRAKRMSQVSSRAFRSVDSRGRWTLLGWLPIGGDLESTSMHLGLRICTPVFILICIPPVMEPRASRRKLTQVLLQEAEICWRSGLSRWSMFCFLVWSEAKVFWWLFFRRSSLGGAVPLLDHEVVVATGSHFVAKRRGRSAQETEGRPRKKGSWRLS